MSQQTTVNQREVAHRLFAAEFGASRIELKGSDERAPSYVVSPLGAKMNRVFVCGVLTEVENIGQGAENWRGRISDPTGIFTVYASQYQPEAMSTLSNLQPPQYVAVVGKCRTYEPEPGNVFVSIRPESITVIDEATRNQWIFDAAKATRDRLVAMRHAMKGAGVSAEDLSQAGVASHLVPGTLLAREKYEGDIDLDYFARTIKDALTYLHEGGQPMPVAAPRPIVMSKPKPKGPGEEIEKRVMAFIESFAARDEKGAHWDLIVQQGEKENLSEDQIEEALNSLMDKGLIYEPILGRLKVT